MTVINGIEIDNINYQRNEIRTAIANNDPIEAKLNVIVVMSNPCTYARRYILTREFIKRMEEDEAEHVNLYVVELAYGRKQRFLVTDGNNPRHLQLRTDTPVIWHKENLVNVAVQRLLPVDFKAFAWVDGDVEFDSASWAQDTLKILNGCKDVVQLFSHCVDMDATGNTLNIFHGFGYSFTKGKPYTKHGKDYWHPGFAWAMTRKALVSKLGGRLYDQGILGSSDNIMALAFIGKVQHMQNSNYHSDYNDSMLEFQNRGAHTLRLGYTPGVIRHYYHGSKQNRRYTERWQILMRHQFSPSTHLLTSATATADIMTTNPLHFSLEFQQDIMQYFVERKEDD